MGDEIASLRARVEALERAAAQRPNLASLIVTSCSKEVLEPLNRLVSTLVALGCQVQVFFTAWGVCLFGDEDESGTGEAVERFRGLVAEWRKCDVKLFACGDSCQIHLVDPQPWRADRLLEPGGLTTFLDRAIDGRLTLVM